MTRPASAAREGYRRGCASSPPIVAAGQRASMSFVLASLRALHIDTRKCPPANPGAYQKTRKSTPQPNPSLAQQAICQH